MSLDALTSVAYGPQAAITVLLAAGVAGLGLVQPVMVAIVVLLFLLVLSYRQVIEAFPNGGGAYAVASKYLGERATMLAAASLVVDYVLTVAVSIAAGVDALIAAFPSLGPAAVSICLAILALIAILNLRGVGEAAMAFSLPAGVFILGILLIIAITLIHPGDPAAVHSFHYPPLQRPLEALSIFLVLKAFSSGCSALTGVEAIANGVPLFKEPRVKRAKRTEAMLGIILGLMLLGLSVIASRYQLQIGANQTILSEVTTIAVGRSWFYYLLSIDVTIVLALAANTSFGGLPVLLSLLARDHRMPHLFGVRGDRLVFSFGIVATALLAGALLVAVDANTYALIPLFAIGVFTGFTLAQSGLIRHWARERPRRWQGKALLNGLGAATSFTATMVFLLTKFVEGAWIVAVAIPALMLLFSRINRYYRVVGDQLALDTIPPPLERTRTLVIVMVNSVSKLTAEALSDAISLGDDVIALSVQFDDASAEKLQALWDEWKPGVRLAIVRSQYHSIIRPTLRFINEIDKVQHRRILVLIPEIQPRRRWHRLLHNQMGIVLEAALREQTTVVVGRLSLRIKE